MSLEVLPQIKSMGNIRLLEESLIALFCSRRCPGDLILKTYDLARALREASVPVIGGFQTPMEKECLRLLLRGSQPVVVCPARGIDNMRIPRDWRSALEDGRLLILSPFPATVRRPTATLAAQRNGLVGRSRPASLHRSRRPRQQDRIFRTKARCIRQATADVGQPSKREPGSDGGGSLPRNAKPDGADELTPPR